MDFRDKVINLNNAVCLKENTTYKFSENPANRPLIAKLSSRYGNRDDAFLTQEFAKMALLSGEPEIGTVYFLATADKDDHVQTCYVMDFIDGYTLSDYLSSSNDLDFEVCFDIVIQLASGIEKAHNYEVFHNDLDGDNIMITKLGYLKIIDFLWFENSGSFEERGKQDLSAFYEILKKIFTKCKIEERAICGLVLSYCSELRTFKGLTSSLKELNSIAFEYNLLSLNTKDILSKLLQSLPSDFRFSNYMNATDFDIPDKYIPPLSENAKKAIAGEYKLHFLDERIDVIQAALERQFDSKLYELCQLNLINWKVRVHTESLIGPYKLNFEINFTSKFLIWHRINSKFHLFSENDTPILVLLIH